MTDRLVMAICTCVGLLALFAIVFMLSARARRRDRAVHESWWRDYRDRERRSYLQLAWRSGLRRDLDESEDDYIRRFKVWAGFE